MTRTPNSKADDESLNILVIKCDKCNKTCSSAKALRNHRLSVHPTVSFYCFHCNHVSKTKQTLSKHMTVHFNPKHQAKQFSCPLCSHVAPGRVSMLQHYERVHDVPLTPKKLEFKTIDEFKSWKSMLEKRERRSYVLDGGAVKTVSKVFHTFRCFRDGYFSSRGKKQRRLKVCGSCKINGICPSRISYSEDRHSGVVSVSYVAAHVGHELDVGRLRLAKDEKQAIARKIAAKIPFDVILNDLRESGVDHEVDRSKLVTRKDLRNIQRDYNLNADGTVHPTL